MRRSLPAAAAVLASALLVLACDSTHPTFPASPQPAADAVPDFGLLDVNATSPTVGTVVSPRDHLGKVSAWYFGHAT